MTSPKFSQNSILFGYKITTSIESSPCFSKVEEQKVKTKIYFSLIRISNVSQLHWSQLLRKKTKSFLDKA